MSDIGIRIKQVKLSIHTFKNRITADKVPQTTPKIQRNRYQTMGTKKEKRIKKRIRKKKEKKKKYKEGKNNYKGTAK